MDWDDHNDQSPVSLEDVFDHITNDKPTRKEELLEIKRTEKKCTRCPMHGGMDNTQRYGKHSNHGQKQKKSTPRYKRER